MESGAEVEPSLLLFMGTIVTDDELNALRGLKTESSANSSISVGTAAIGSPYRPGVSVERGLEVLHAHITCMDVSNTGLLAVGSSRGDIWILKVSLKGSATTLVPALSLSRIDESDDSFTSYATTIRWSPCASFLAVGTSRGNMLVFEVAMARLRLSISQQLHQYHPITSIAWSSDTCKVFSGCARGKVVELVVKPWSEMGTFAFAASLFGMNSTRVLLYTGQPIREIVYCTSIELYSSEVERDVISVCSGDLLAVSVSPRASASGAASSPPTVHELSRGCRGMCWRSINHSFPDRKGRGSVNAGRNELLVSLDPDFFMQDAHIKNLGSVFTNFDISMNVPLSTFLCAEVCEIQGLDVSDSRNKVEIQRYLGGSLLRSEWLRDASMLDHDAQSFRNLQLVGNQDSTAIGITWDNNLGIVDFKSKLYYVLDILHDVVSISMVNNDIFVLHRIMATDSDGSTDWKHAIHVIKVIGQVAINRVPSDTGPRPSYLSLPDTILMRMCPIVNYIWLSSICKAQRLYRSFRDRKRASIESRSSPPDGQIEDISSSDGWIKGWEVEIHDATGYDRSVRHRLTQRRKTRRQRNLRSVRDLELESFQQLRTEIEEKKTYAVKLPLYSSCGAGIKFELRDDGMMHVCGFSRPTLENPQTYGNPSSLASHMIQRSYAEACGLIEVGDILVEIDGDKMQQLSVQTTIQKLQELVIDSVKKAHVTMRFQYSASEAVAPLGGQNVTRELSEAPELLLDSVLNPVSVASLSTAPIREPKEKSVKKSSLSDPYLLDMGMMFASYIPEVHMDAIGEDYEQTESPLRPQVASNQSEHLSPGEEAGELLEGWTLGTEDVFDGAKYDAQALTFEIRKLMAAKRALYPCAALYSVDKGLFEDVLMSSPVKALKLASNDLDYWKLLHMRASISGFYRKDSPPFLRNKLYFVPSRLYSSSSGDAFIGMLHDWSTEEKRFRSKRSRELWFKLSESYPICDEGILNTISAAVSIDFDSSHPALGSDLRSLASLNLELCRMIDCARADASLIPNVLFLYTTFVTRLTELSEIEHRMRTIQAPYRQRSRSDASSEDGDSNSSYSSGCQDRYMARDYAIGMDKKNDISIDRVLDDGAPWLVDDKASSESSVLMPKQVNLATESLVILNWTDPPSEYVKNWRQSRYKFCDGILSSYDPVEALFSWIRPCMDDHSALCPESQYIDLVVMFCIVICEVSASSIGWLSNEFDKSAHTTMSALFEYIYIHAERLFRVESKENDFLALLCRVQILHYIIRTLPSSLACFDAIGRVPIECFCSVLFNIGIEISGATDVNSKAEMNMFGTMTELVQELSLICSELPFDALLAVAIANNNDIECINLVLNKFREASPDIAWTSVTCYLLECISAGGDESNIAPQQITRSLMTGAHMGTSFKGSWLCLLMSSLEQSLVHMRSSNDSIEEETFIALSSNLSSLVSSSFVRHLIYAHWKDGFLADQVYLRYILKLDERGVRGSSNELFRLRLRMSKCASENMDRMSVAEVNTKSAVSLSPRVVRQGCCLAWGAAAEAQCRCKPRPPTASPGIEGVGDAPASFKPLVKRSSFVAPKRSNEEEARSLPQPHPRVLDAVFGCHMDESTLDAFCALFDETRSQELHPLFVISCCIECNRPIFLFVYIHILISSLNESRSAVMDIPPKSALLDCVLKTLRRDAQTQPFSETLRLPMNYSRDCIPRGDSGDEDLIDPLFRACEQSLCAVIRSLALNRSVANIDENMDLSEVCDECRQSLYAVKIGTEVLHSLCVVTASYMAPAVSLEDRMQALLDIALCDVPSASIADCKRLIKRWCSLELAESSTSFLLLTRRTTM